VRRGGRHRRRGLAGGDDDVAGVGDLLQCALDQRPGRGRSDTGPDERQEIVSKIRE